MREPSRRLYGLSALALTAMIVAGLNVALDATLTQARIDLTQDRRFTLSEGTRNILHALKEPLHLKMYYSRRTAAHYPQISAYAARVRNLLASYVAAGDGKIVLEEIDPEPYTDAEDEAAAGGVAPVPAGNGTSIYFGLTAENRIDGHAAIAYFSPEREPMVEYDVTALIHRLADPTKPKLAVLTSLALDGRGEGGQPAIFRALAGSYDMVKLPATFSRVPADTRVLMIVHPGPLNDSTLYAIDQFVMRGGRAAVFVDPDCEVLLPPQDAGTGENSSDLPRLFRAWGVDYSTRQVLADIPQAPKVRTDANAVPGRDPSWLHVTADGFDARDPVSASLNAVNFASAGIVNPRRGATTKFAPLIYSSDRATPIEPHIIRAISNGETLAAAVQPTGERYVVAARLTGPAVSAFAAAPPPGVGLGIRSARAINVVVVADTDLLADRFWLRTEGGRAIEFSDNEAFIFNIVENLMGTDDLLSLHPRARGERPFTKVQALEAAAQKRYRVETDKLQTQLAVARDRLLALQQKATVASAVAPDAKKSTDIERSRRELAETRMALRQVQRDLNLDVARLGNRMAFANIALMPILVVIVGSIVAFWRRRRQRALQRLLTEGKTS